MYFWHHTFARISPIFLTYYLRRQSSLLNNGTPLSVFVYWRTILLKPSPSAVANMFVVWRQVVRHNRSITNSYNIYPLGGIISVGTSLAVKPKSASVAIWTCQLIRLQWRHFLMVSWRRNLWHKGRANGALISSKTSLNQPLPSSFAGRLVAPYKKAWKGSQDVPVS